MPTKTKKTTKTEYVWYTSGHGDYRIERSRWGTYTSYDREGQGLITGLTEESVHTATCDRFRRLSEKT